MAERPPGSAWYDLTLGTMGAALAVGFGAGYVWMIPFRVTGSLAAIFAATVLVGTTIRNPPSE